MLLDIGNWDPGWRPNAPGQSGHGRSPHHRDLSDTWASGAPLPFLSLREAVDAAAELRIVFRPAKA